MTRTVHLRPAAELAPRVLLPDDPGRALALAQSLFAATPRMFNHHRGLWGYTGTAAADGEPLSVQATGIGGPSAAAVVRDLAALGARRLVRVGGCGGLRGDLEPGTLVVVTEAVCGDGASRALGAGGRVSPDGALLAALRAAAPRAAAGPVLSRDLFDDGADAPADALGVDLETAAVLAAARERGLAAAAVLAVTGPAGAAADPDDAAAEATGRVAATALSRR